MIVLVYILVFIGLPCVVFESTHFFQVYAGSRYAKHVDYHCYLAFYNGCCRHRQRTSVFLRTTRITLIVTTKK